MKEIPILFKTEMVSAIMEGRKTQERRPVFLDKRIRFTSPFGQVGDMLLVSDAGFRVYKPIANYDDRIEYMKRGFFLELKVKRVWVEKVQDISEEDALCEGSDAISSFFTLWDSIYKNLDENPLVWCCEFEVIPSKEVMEN